MRARKHWKRSKRVRRRQEVEGGINLVGCEAGKPFANAYVRWSAKQIQ